MIDIDCILGNKIISTDVEPTTSPTIKYYERTVGKIHIPISQYNILKRTLPSKDNTKYIIAGITRNAYENNLEPPLLDTSFITEGYKKIYYPTDFRLKVYHLLKYIHKRLESSNEPINLQVRTDYPLIYGDHYEFLKIINYLHDHQWISWLKLIEDDNCSMQKIYCDIKITPSGEKEIEKILLPNLMVYFLAQETKTGDSQLDEKVSHAIKLFYRDGATKDDLRSACETLSYILEPLRKDLTKFFTSSDVNDFFQIVNNFDIRHNKPSTSNIIYKEQYEWIFYTLLNTINTFIKLKDKPV